MRIKVVVILLLLCSVAAWGQSKSQLESKKKKLNEEMKTTSKLIDQTQKSKRGAENKLLLTQQSIRQGKEYITLLNSEIEMLNHDIDSIEAEKLSYIEKLDYLRKEYAEEMKLLYRQSKRNSFADIIYVLTAQNLNQGYRRFRYLQQLSARRKAKAIEIGAIADSLTSQELKLTENREAKAVAMSEREVQQQKLEKQQASQKQQVNDLKKKEKELRKKLTNQQNQIAQLQKKIQQIIEQEIAAAQKKKSSTSTSSKTTSGGTTTYEMSKEEKLIAGNFEANRGRLPRPVASGNITGHFGEHPHPYLDKVMVNNKGIYIQSPAGTDARAVFEGVVTSVFVLPGANSSVIIRHGNYSTVYHNLSTVYVKKGDKVAIKQKIGRIFTDTENGNKTELMFLMYKDKTLLNPELWLAK